MALQIRRGLNSERITKVLQNGEIAWTTDTKKLYIGDGVTTGGTNILQSAQGVGLSWNPVTEQLDLTASTLFINSSNVTETTNLFHTAQRAQDAAAALFTNAAGDHVGISFVYDSVNHKLTATVGQENIEDKVGAVLVAGNSTNTGITFTYDATADSNNRVNAAVDIEYLQDQVAAFFAAGNHVGITYTYEDNNNKINSTVNLLGSLAGNLSLNGNNINGTGNIDITGNITASRFDIDSIRTTNKIAFDGITSTFGGQFTGAYKVFRQRRGSFASPTAVQSGDMLGGLECIPYTATSFLGANGYSYGGVATFYSDPSIPIDSTSKFIPTQFFINCSDGKTIDLVNKSVVITSAGTLKAPILQTGTYATGAYPVSGAISALTVSSVALNGVFTCTSTTLSVGGIVTITGTDTNSRISGYVSGNTYYIIATNGTTSFTLSTTGNGSAITTTAGAPTGLTFTVSLPQKGMIIFDSTTNDFMGYNGTNWIAFTGP